MENSDSIAIQTNAGHYARQKSVKGQKIRALTKRELQKFAKLSQNTSDAVIEWVSNFDVSYLAD